MEFVVLLGRIFFSTIFILSGFSHFSAETVDFAAASGVPLASILVPISALLALVGGLSILLGFKAKIGAWLLVLFLVPVTLMMHPFWNFTDPVSGMLQMIMFMKNLALTGGALIIAYFGSGPLSLRH